MLFRRAATLLLLLAAVYPSAAQGTDAHQAQLEKDKKELLSYSLTMDVVTRAFMTISAIREAGKTDAEIEKVMKPKDSDVQPTLDEMTAVLTSSPKIVAIVTAHGFKPRELTLAEICLIQTSFAIMAIDSGSSVKEIVDGGQARADNLKLLRDHKAEVDALSKKYPMMDNN